MPRKDPEARATYLKEYAERRKEELREYHAQYRKKNAEIIKTKKKQAWIDNNEVERAKLRERYAKNPEYWKAYNKRAYNKNPSRAIAYSRKYRVTNPEAVKLGKKRYVIENNHIVNAAVARRKATKLQQTPKWVDFEELWLIKEVYALSAQRTKMTGFIWHVDHIIPLQGKTVSGLHVIENLQVIPGVDNIRKANKYRAA